MLLQMLEKLSYTVLIVEAELVVCTSIVHMNERTNLVGWPSVDQATLHWTLPVYTQRLKTHKYSTHVHCAALISE